MAENKPITVEMIRAAMQSLGAGGKEVSYQLIYEALELDSESMQAVVRSKINDMTKHGEVERVRLGCFTYNFKHRPREAKTFEILWRFVRKAKPGWTLSECAMMTRESYTRALRYCTWLEEEGFVIPIGKAERNATAFRCTAKADQTPETPYPPLRAADPFAKERTAAATITRLLLCADPRSRKTARDITDACRILLERFEPVTKNENANPLPYVEE